MTIQNTCNETYTHSHRLMLLNWFFSSLFFNYLQEINVHLKSVRMQIVPTANVHIIKTGNFSICSNKLKSIFCVIWSNRYLTVNREIFLMFIAICSYYQKIFLKKCEHRKSEKSLFIIKIIWLAFRFQFWISV